jgi:hypothetical protein
MCFTNDRSRTAADDRFHWERKRAEAAKRDRLLLLLVHSEHLADPVPDAPLVRQGSSVTGAPLKGAPRARAASSATHALVEHHGAVGGGACGSDPHREDEH